MNQHSGIAVVGAGIVGMATLALAWSGSPVSAQRTQRTPEALPVVSTSGPGLRSTTVARMLPRDTAPTAPVRLFEWRFAGEVALATAGSLVLLPVDERVRSWMQDPARQESAGLHHTAHAFIQLGSAGPMIAAAALYGVGLVAGSPTAADVGLHVGEAIAGAGATTVFLKILAGRKGPSPDGPYAFGSGPFLDPRKRSKAFPSGHATLAFALAGALTEEASQHWPGTERWVGPVTFITATGVAAALAYDGHHWASDVL
ncbi:MAG: phosphatase PAP2 family protein, partial [Gemmatimonadetes bacterium]|nr:phosphatase PAP2 family protein [Gemmatimonadota bacterium]